MATSNSDNNQPKYKHLLIIRTSALGDVAMLPHTVRAFKEAYPKVKVSILTKKFLRPLFDGLDVNFICRETPENIYRRSREMLERTADRGGYALGSGNSIPAYIPVDGYMAMVKAAWDFK